MGYDDKWRHFMVSYRVTKECPFGFVYVLPGGLLKELWDNVYPPRDWNDSLTDMLANVMGWLEGMRSNAMSCTE